MLAYFIGCRSLLPSESAVCRVYSVQRFQSHFDTWAPYIGGQIFKNPTFLSTHANGKRERFDQAFTVIRQELLDAFASQAVPKDAQLWYTRVRSFDHPKISDGVNILIGLFIGRVSTITSRAAS